MDRHGYVIADERLVELAWRGGFATPDGGRWPAELAALRECAAA